MLFSTEYTSETVRLCAVRSAATPATCGVAIEYRHRSRSRGARAATALGSGGHRGDHIVRTREHGGATRSGDHVLALVHGEVRVRRTSLVPVGGDDAEGVRREAGLAADRGEVVPGGRDDDHTSADRVVDRMLGVVELAHEDERLHARQAPRLRLITSATAIT